MVFFAENFDRFRLDKSPIKWFIALFNFCIPENRLFNNIYLIEHRPCAASRTPYTVECVRRTIHKDGRVRLTNHDSCEMSK